MAATKMQENGADLVKAIKLLPATNPTLFARLQTIYFTRGRDQAHKILATSMGAKNFTEMNSPRC